MNKKTLYLYKDKIKKLHKAAYAFKKCSDEFNKFQDNELLGDDFSLDGSDFEKLKKFLFNHPELNDMLTEVDKIVEELNE